MTRLRAAWRRSHVWFILACAAAFGAFMAALFAVAAVSLHRWYLVGGDVRMLAVCSFGFILCRRRLK